MALNEEQLFERRHAFLTQRLAGGTYSAIARRYNERQLEEAMKAGRDPDTADAVSVTTVRKDVERAKAELLDTATRDALRGEHRAILLDMRRANYAAMAAGDVDAAKIVMSTLVREAEMFGLDEPKRSQIGVGTDVEFATDLVGLIEAVGYQPPPDLLFAAGRSTDEARAIENRHSDETVEAEVVPLDGEAASCDEPQPARRSSVERDRDAAAGGGPSEEAAHGDPDSDDPWSNL